jgi:lactoylglutathione lyase
LAQHSSETIPISLEFGSPRGNNAVAFPDLQLMLTTVFHSEATSHTIATGVCPMKYLHTMVRVTDLDQSLHFYCDLLGLTEIRRREDEKGRYTLVFLAPPGQDDAPIELTFNWDPEPYTGGRNFGHLAYEVDDIYAFCQKLMENGVTINRPPRDGRMAFVRSPDNISIEILQKGQAQPPEEPWVSMPNTGAW